MKKTFITISALLLALSLFTTNIASAQTAFGISTGSSNYTYGGSGIVCVTLSIGGGATYTWNWGDGSPNYVTTSIDNITHQFPSAGNFTVSLTTTGDINSNNNNGIFTKAVTINPAPLSITANNQSKGYGAAFSTLTASYTGLVNGDTPASLTTPPTLTTIATAASSVAGSPYPITASGAVDANYTISYAPGQLTVTPAPLSVIANNQTKAYGAPLPILTASYSGFVNGDTQAGLAMQPTISTNGTVASPVGTYLISASGAVNPNYTISYTSGTLTVSPETITITANPKSKTYGDNDPPLTYTFSPALQGTDGFSGSLTRNAGVNVGTYAITQGTLALSNNYSLIYNSANLSITTKALTITANNQFKTYDGIPYSGGNGVSYSGFALGEAATNLSGTLTYSGTAQGAVNTGTYSLIPSGYSSTNYTLGYVPGTLSISSSLSNMLTFNTQSTGSTRTATYGDADINGSAVASSGLPAAYISGNTAVATINNLGQVHIVGVGTTTITASQAGNINYDPAANISFTLTVNPKTLTVTANDASKTYDGVAYTGGNGVTYSGFITGDNQSHSITGTLSYGGTSQGAVNTGSYTIIPAGLTATNYALTYMPGTLNITAAGGNVLTFNGQTAGSTVTATYGDAAINASAVASSGLAVSYVSGNTAVATVNSTGQVNILTAGTTTITASQGGDANHTAATPISFSLTVQKKALTITANNYSKTYDGIAYSGGNGVSYTGFVNGEHEQNLQGTLSFTGTAIGAKDVDSYFINPGGYTSNNYAITYQAGSLTITKAALTIAASARSKVYGDMDPAFTYTSTGLILTDGLTGTLTRAAGENVGVYTISQGTLSAGGNYSLVYTGANLSITTKALSITANNYSKTYDGIAYSGGNGLSYSGFVNGDDASKLTGTVTYTGTAQGAVNTGVYTIIPGGLSSANYALSYMSGQLTISPSNINTLSFDTQTVGGMVTATYGDAAISATAVASSTLAASYVSSNTAVATVSSAGQVNILTAGTTTITASQGGDANHAAASPISFTINVQKKALAVTATSQGKTYGSPDPALTYTINPALIGTDAFTGGLSRNVGERVDNYAISQGTLSAGANYAITYTGANLTIGKAALTITANNASKAYGTANPALTVSFSGFVNGDTQLSLATQPTISTAAVTGSPVGTYPITVSGAVSPNYNISYTAGILTVSALSNAGLANLSISTGTLSPAFATVTSAYTVSVGNTTTSVTVTPTLADATATVKVNGTTVSSGSASANIPLTVGANTITTVVTAQDGTTTKTYTITVTRAASGIASLAALATSSGIISPAFVSSVLGYATQVDNATGTIAVTATPTDPTASITVNGAPVNNGTPSGNIPLNVGANTITIVATAQDGISKQTYTLTVQRGIPPETVTATNILTPNGDGKNDYWVVKDIRLYPDNYVRVYDRAGRLVYNKHGYDNTWDGTLNGSPLLEGTYYYIVELGVGQPQFKGFVSIIRSK